MAVIVYHEDMMGSTGYIYGLIDPRDRLFYYVGQTRREPLIRLAQHWQQPTCKAMAVWISDLRDHGVRPFLHVLEQPDLSLLRRRETYWIAALITHKMPLLNTFYAIERSYLEKQDPWALPSNPFPYTPDTPSND